MAFLKKLIYFFSNKFYSNLKFKNKFLAKTRLLFEKVSKQSKSVSLLGNVYKNSKWTDFKNPNVQVTALIQYYTLTISLFFILCFLTNRSLFEFYIFCNEALSETYAVALDVLYSLGYFLFGIILITVQFYIYNVLPLLGPLFNMPVKEDPQEALPTKMIANNVHTLLNTSPTLNRFGNFNIAENYPLESSFYMYKLLQVLHTDEDTLLGSSTTNYAYFSKLNLFYTHDLLPLLIFLEGKNVDSAFAGSNISHFFTLPAIYKGTHHDESSLTLPNYSVTTANVLKPLERSLLAIINKNLQSNIAFGRDFRWGLKHTILSQEVIQETLKHTHIKKTFGEPILNQKIKNSNIWFSSQFKESMLYALDPLRSNKLGPKTSKTAFIEESIFWNLKRFQAMHTSISSTHYTKMPLTCTSVSFYQGFVHFPLVHTSKKKLTKKSIDWDNLDNSTESLKIMLNDTISFWAVSKKASTKKYKTNSNYTLQLDSDYNSILSLDSLLFTSFISANNTSYNNQPVFYSNLTN